MKENPDLEYVRRSSKDYSLSFKLEVIQEIESGELGIKEAQHKYGIQGNATNVIKLREFIIFVGSEKRQTTVTNYYTYSIKR